MGGYAAGGGTIYGLAEYDRFMEEARSVGLDPEDVKPEAIIAAVTEGGLEGVSNLLDMALMKVGTPLTGAVSTRLEQFAKNYIKVVASEVPTEMAQAAAGTAIRNEAGFPEQNSWEAAKDSIRPTLVASLGFAGAGTALRRKRSEPTSEKHEDLANSLTEDLEDSDSPVEVESTTPQQQAEPDPYSEAEVNKRYIENILMAREENAAPFDETVDLLRMQEPTVTP